MLIATQANSVAFEALNTRSKVADFKKVADVVSTDRMNALIKAKLSTGPALTDMTADEKAIFSKYSTDDWKAFASGSFGEPSFYETLVNILPN
jgi:hypothetical protein